MWYAVLNAIACILVVTVQGCGTTVQNNDRFYREPVSLQIEKMRKLSIEAQYETYERGVTSVHPPALYLSDAIAERGKEAIPYLLERIDTASDPMALNILHVFVMMEALKRIM